MNRYGTKAHEEVEKAMHEYKHVDAFKDRKQAVAVGLAKARKSGANMPTARHMQHK